jgi:hypothetical protein
MDGLLFGQEISFNAGSEYGDGINNIKDVAELAKALTVGYEMGTTDQTGFGATRRESLASTLSWQAAEEKSAKFIKSLRRGKANGTVEEFATLNEIGGANFYSEGGLPEEFDEDLRREFEQVKYLGAVGQVPFPATKVDSIAGAIDTVTRAKTTAILRFGDVKLFFADSAVNPLEFNGYYKQFKTRAKYPTQNTIDLRGKRLTPEAFNEAGSIISSIGNYGDGMNLKVWMGNTAFKNYTDELLANRRFVVNGGETRDIVANAKKFEVGLGGGNIETDIFLETKGSANVDNLHPKLNKAKTAFAATTSKPPTTLNAAHCSATTQANTSTKLPVGDYKYAVVPINKFGAGAAFELESAVSVEANKEVIFTISDNSSASGQEALSFDIYRKNASEGGLTDYKFLKNYKAGTTIVDDGDEIPGTTYAFAWDWNFDQVLDFLELAPLYKMDLAVISDAYRWLQKWYVVPILRNPNRMIVFKNVGKEPWS